MGENDWLKNGPVDNAVGMDYLYAPPGGELHADGLEVEQVHSGRKELGASLSSPTPHFTVGTGSNESAGYGDGELRAHPSNRSGMMGTSPSPAPQRTREPTPEELMAAAMAMVDKHTVQHQTQLSQGPATGNRTDSGGSVPAWLTQEMERDTDL